jgi:ABC-type uncharacterized transport system ATPase subunit
MTKLESGHVTIDDTETTGSSLGALKAGLAVIPEDRREEGLALSLPAWKNAVARSTFRREFLTKRRHLDRRRAVDFCRRVMDRMHVRPADPGMKASAFSGGNQQRLIVSRELAHRPAVVVAAEPTRGLDPKGAVEVAEAVLDAAAHGAAVLLLSSDLDEMLPLVHRVVVLYRGRIVANFDAASIDREQLGLAMAGAIGS